jgi:hypothetical protein
MDNELSGLAAAFPPDEFGLPRTPLAERAANVCAMAQLLLMAMGYDWEAYNFKQAGESIVDFNVKYPGIVDGEKVWWVTSGSMQFDGGSDTALAQSIAAYWDREFRGVNPHGKVAE